MISIKVDSLPALDIVHTFSGGFVRNKPIGCPFLQWTWCIYSLVRSHTFCILLVKF